MCKTVTICYSQPKSHSGPEHNALTQCIPSRVDGGMHRSQQPTTIPTSSTTDLFSQSTEPRRWYDKHSIRSIGNNQIFSSIHFTSPSTSHVIYSILIFCSIVEMESIRKERETDRPFQNLVCSITPNWDTSTCYSWSFVASIAVTTVLLLQFDIFIFPHIERSSSSGISLVQPSR